METFNVGVRHFEGFETRFRIADAPAIYDDWHREFTPETVRVVHYATGYEINGVDKYTRITAEGPDNQSNYHTMRTWSTNETHEHHQTASMPAWIRELVAKHSGLGEI